MAEGSFYFDVDGQGMSVFLGPTESRLMEIAWQHPDLSVKKALFHLGPEPATAYTTVMTVLNRLVDKGLLERRREGRNFVYRAAIGRDEFIRSRIDRIRNCLKTNFPDTQL